MIEPTESEDKAELDRFCDAMIHIRKEIAQIESGQLSKEDNPLKNAPHTASVVTADKWEHAYSRSQAAWPQAGLKQNNPNPNPNPHPHPHPHPHPNPNPSPSPNPNSNPNPTAGAAGCAAGGGASVAQAAHGAAQRGDHAVQRQGPTGGARDPAKKPRRDRRA